MKCFTNVATAVLTAAVLMSSGLCSEPKTNAATPAAKPAAKAPQEKHNFKFITTVNKSDAIFKKGEPVTLSVKLCEDGKPAKDLKLLLVASINGKTVKREWVDAGKGGSFTTKLDKPGWVSLVGSVYDQKKKPVRIPNDRYKRAYNGGTGAMVAPEEITPGRPTPKDFQAFWAKQRAELDKVPVKELSRVQVDVPKHLKGKVNCWDVKVACAGNAPVSGYLCIPVNAKPKSLPAVVSYHGAGVRSANKPFRSDAIALDVNAHGIDNGKPEKFYVDLIKGKLNNYSRFGKESRDTFYFKNMYLRVMRAMDYVMSLPEWNGKVLVVRGGSQGGGQSLAAAALNPKVTLCRASVPALGDHGGEFAGRMAGWPRGLYEFKNGKAVPEKNAEVADYFDNNNFAKMIKCETWVCTGFIDFVCPPTSVYSAYNSLATKNKHMVTTRDAGHNAPLKPGDQRVNQVLSGK